MPAPHRATAAADPIHAALARVRRAGAALSRVAPTHFAAASAEHIAAVDALAEIRPTTIDGIRALVRHRLRETRDEEGCGDGSRAVLVQVSKALARPSA